MTATLIFIIWKLLLPLLLLVAVIDVLTQSPQQRICRLHRAGYSQRSIAARLGVTTHRVRKALA